MNSFLTIEDINGVLLNYRNVPFWYRVSVSGNDEFYGNYYDFCQVSKTAGNVFTITVDNDLWCGYFYALNSNGEWLDASYSNDTITVVSDTSSVELYFLLAGFLDWNGFVNCNWIVKDIDSLVIFDNNTVQKMLISVESVDGSELSTVNIFEDTYSVVDGVVTYNGQFGDVDSVLISKGDVEFEFPLHKIKEFDYVILNDNLTLINGEVNTVPFYSNTSDFTVQCDYPVTKQGNYLFVDLTGKDNQRDLKLSIVADEIETEYRMPCDYRKVMNISELMLSVAVGGIIRLGADITLIDNIMVDKNIVIYGEDHNINCNGSKFIIGAGVTFKCNDTAFINGFNTIQQNVGSSVYVTGCSFSNCTGLGSVIDCQVDVGSLENPNDFITELTDCEFFNNDMCILHGGDLTVDGCTVTGKVWDKDYPYFLYQTDGSAIVLNSSFHIASESVFESDIGFNPAIFIVGSEAIVNGRGQGEWNDNNILTFLNSNTSSVDLRYHYDLISDTIHLTADNGYCYAVSGSDYLFKANVTIARGE